MVQPDRIHSVLHSHVCRARQHLEISRHGDGKWRRGIFDSLFNRSSSDWTTPLLYGALYGAIRILRVR